MNVSVEIKPAGFPARYFRARIGQTTKRRMIAFQFIGGNDPDVGMRFRNFHHAAQAFRENPVVRLHHLAVLATSRDERKREIVILHLVEERIGVDETNLAGILGGILRGDFRGTIGAVIVDEDVLPIRIGLAKDAFNTLREEFVSVIEGSNNADERRRLHDIRFQLRDC